jgi:hypothetical protein
VLGASTIYASKQAYVCDVARNNTNCPALSCAGLLSGWNNNVCQRYTVDSGGYCDDTASCLTQCGKVPQQSSVQVVRCASTGCVRDTTCQTGDPISVRAERGRGGG